MRCYIAKRDHWVLENFMSITNAHEKGVLCMNKKKWAGIEKNAKTLKKNVKNLAAASEYLKNLPEEGYMLDNISKNVVEIKTCKSSSLRRYVKLLNNYFYLMNTEADRTRILKKKIEVEKELNGREDGLKG